MEAPAATMANGVPVCHFWQQGRCRFGDSCRFAHPERVPSAAADDDVEGAYPELGQAATAAEEQEESPLSSSARLNKWGVDVGGGDKVRAPLRPQSCPLCSLNRSARTGPLTTADDRPGGRAGARSRVPGRVRLAAGLRQPGDLDPWALARHEGRPRGFCVAAGLRPLVLASGHLARGRGRTGGRAPAAPLARRPRPAPLTPALPCVSGQAIATQMLGMTVTEDAPDQDTTYTLKSSVGSDLFGSDKGKESGSGDSGGLAAAIGASGGRPPKGPDGSLDSALVGSLHSSLGSAGEAQSVDAIASSVGSSAGGGSLEEMLAAEAEALAAAEASGGAGGGAGGGAEFAAAGGGSAGGSGEFSADGGEAARLAQEGHREELCQYHMAGYCANGLSCPFIHGDICPTCGMACLNPFNEQEKQAHLDMCMEAVLVHQESEASRGLQCGICLETPYEAGVKFGILPNCVHVFCLDCIRSWRTNSETYGSEAVRVCPVCRVESYFVVPCERFVDDSDPERKQVLLDGYKESLARIPCVFPAAFQPHACLRALWSALRDLRGALPRAQMPILQVRRGDVSVLGGRYVVRRGRLYVLARGA